MQIIIVVNGNDKIASTVLRYSAKFIRMYVYIHCRIKEWTLGATPPLPRPAGALEKKLVKRFVYNLIS